MRQNNGNQFLVTFDTIKGKDIINYRECLGFQEKYIYATHILQALSSYLAYWYARLPKQDDIFFLPKTIFSCRLFNKCYIFYADVVRHDDPITKWSHVDYIDFSRILSADQTLDKYLPNIFYSNEDGNCQHESADKMFLFSFSSDAEKTMTFSMNSNGFGLFAWNKKLLYSYAIKSILGLYSYYIYEYKQRSFFQDAIQFVSEAMSIMFINNEISTHNAEKIANQIFISAYYKLLKALTFGNYEKIELSNYINIPEIDY